MAHEARNDVNWSAGFQQFRSDAVPEAVNTDVNAFRGFNSKFRHCPMHAGPYNVVRQVGFALGVGEQIAVRVWLIVFVEPVAQMFREQLGHADRSRTIVTLRGAFLSSGIVQGTGDVDEFPLEVKATDFQGCDFADPQAAHCGDEEHELVGIHRGIDDSRGGICVEEKYLRLRFFVSREYDVPFFHGRDRVTPLPAQVQNRAKSAVYVLRGLPAIDAPADCGYERLVLAEAQFTQRKLANLRKYVGPNMRQGSARSPRFSIRKDFFDPFITKCFDCFIASRRRGFKVCFGPGVVIVQVWLKGSFGGTLR